MTEPRPHAVAFELDNWQVIPIPPSEILNCWQQIEASLDHDPEVWNVLDTKESIQRNLLHGLSVAWATFYGDRHLSMMMTRILDFPSGVRVLSIWFMAGELDRSLPIMSDAIRAYAIRIGAHHVEVEGRRGWAKVLAPYGFKETRVTLRAPVMERMH